MTESQPLTDEELAVVVARVAIMTDDAEGADFAIGALASLRLPPSDDVRGAGVLADLARDARRIIDFADEARAHRSAPVPGGGREEVEAIMEVLAAHGDFADAPDVSDAQGREDCALAILALLASSPAVGSPARVQTSGPEIASAEGFVLVPREPTEAMIACGAAIMGGGRVIAVLSIENDCDEDTQDDWEAKQRADAMLFSAAPELLAGAIAVKQAREDYQSWACGGEAGRAILALAGVTNEKELRTQTETAFGSLAAAIAKATNTPPLVGEEGVK